MPRWQKDAQLCGNCGHWSESSESGLSPGVGYCAYWDRVRERVDTCDHFLAIAAYRSLQARLAAENEEWIDV